MGLREKAREIRERLAGTADEKTPDNAKKTEKPENLDELFKE